jgi:hypothetical protein
MHKPSTAIASAGAAIMGIQRRNKATWSLSVNVKKMGGQEETYSTESQGGDNPCLVRSERNRRIRF